MILEESSETSRFLVNKLLNSLNNLTKLTSKEQGCCGAE